MPSARLVPHEPHHGRVASWLWQLQPPGSSWDVLSVPLLPTSRFRGLRHESRRLPVPEYALMLVHEYTLFRYRVALGKQSLGGCVPAVGAQHPWGTVVPGELSLLGTSRTRWSWGS